MLNKLSFSWDKYHQAPIVGIMRGYTIELTYQVAKTYLEAGLYTLEVTMNTEEATKIIQMLRKDFPQLNVGAGTVCNLVDMDNALEAGAQFIVTPVIQKEVIQKAVGLQIPIFPGAYSPTEIYQAWSLGASAVKVFPASQLGVKYIKDILAPLNDVRLLPTGGVSLDNINAFFEAGVFGVGMGSSLLHKQLIQENNFEGLKEHFIKIKSSIREYLKD